MQYLEKSVEQILLKIRIFLILLLQKCRIIALAHFGLYDYTCLFQFFTLVLNLVK